MSAYCSASIIQIIWFCLLQTFLITVSRLFELVCSGRDLTYVNSRLFLSARNGIKFFELSVHDDKNTVQKILMNTDISFRVQLTTSDGIMMEKRFGIETNFTSRTKRWSPWSYWSIHQPHLFPNYNQHRCCGCYSRCGPVAWAQIFAYYDRYKTWYRISGWCRNLVLEWFPRNQESERTPQKLVIISDVTLKTTSGFGPSCSNKEKVNLW